MQFGSPEELTPKQKFAKYIADIRLGLLGYEPEARSLAKEYGLPLHELDKALETGRERARYIDLEVQHI